MNENPFDPVLPESTPSYNSWDDQDSMLDAFNKSTGETYMTSRASYNRQFQGIDGNTSVRDGFSRTDYEFFRPGEALPKTQKESIAHCMHAYEHLGFIKNIIDIMGEFGSQGICITHPHKETEEIYNAWFEKVEASERSERFLNTLYKAGNVVVRRYTARYKGSDIKNLEKSMAAPDIKTFSDTEVLADGELPIRYKYYDPCQVELLNPELSVFSDKYLYGLKIPTSVKTAIARPKDPVQVSQVNNIPKGIRDGITKSNSIYNLLMLDPKKTDVYHYKKDDWKAWGNPILYSVLDDIILYRKCRLADLTALDGAISYIRIWKLGNLDAKIIPNPAELSRFASMIMNAAANGSVMDLVWHPAIDLLETKTDIGQFLESGKYQNVLQSIYAALGYPQAMTGSGKKSGMTSDFLQIKTLVERLKYGRMILNKMWMKELNLVRAALKGKPGFNWKVPPKISYDHSSLTDEATQTKLVLDMLDRDVISKETAQSILGADPDLEKARLLRELADRKKLPKVSPYHDAQPDLSLEKLFVQRGVVTPSEVGINLDESDPSQEKMRQLPPDPNAAPAGGPLAKKKKPKGKSGQGRPKTSTDTTKRKQRIPLVASELIWAKNAYQKISDYVTPIFLEKFSKSSIRKFTNEESSQFEEYKFGVISNIDKLTPITEEVILEAISRPFTRFYEVNAIYKESVEGIENQLTLDDRREIFCMACLAETSSDD